MTMGARAPKVHLYLSPRRSYKYMQGSVIRIFLKDGKPDGLRTIELTLSTVLGTIFPRPSLEKFLEGKSAQKPGVYILIGRDTDTNDSQMVYVGEGDPVGPRLKAHGVQKEFWTEAAVFTSKDDYLAKTQIQYLEAKLVETIKSAARANLDNVNSPTYPNISEADEAEVSGFFETINLFLGASGFNFLQSWEEPAISDRTDEVFSFQIGDAVARMIRSTSSYIVLAGSTARATLVPSAGPWIERLRRQLMEAGNLITKPDTDLLEFTKDTAFDSPSSAAAVVYGGNRNGPLSWKLEDGRTLKEIENSIDEGGS